MNNKKQEQKKANTCRECLSFKFPRCDMLRRIVSARDKACAQFAPRAVRR